MSKMDLTNEQIAAVIKEQGSIRKAALYLDIPRSTLRSAMSRRGVVDPEMASRAPKHDGSSLPRVTRESLHAALQPPNTCTVKAFLDGLGEDDRDVVNEALGYSPRDFSARALRDWLMNLGFKESTLPTTQHISDHRGRHRPCRCDS